VLVELAPASVAPPATAPEVSPDLIDQLEVPEPMPELRPILSEVEPLPDLTPPGTPEMPVTDAPPPIDTALAVLPAPRPRARPATPPPKEPPERKEAVREKPREQKVRAAAAAPPAPAAATKATGRGAEVSPARWQSRLMAHLERRKRYPAAARGRREEGVVHVWFTIDAAGNVLSARITRSSGHEALDAEVLALVRRASPVPAPPSGAPRAITAPVEFHVR
jgi:protein TonB